MLGTTKPLTIDLEFNGAAKDPFGNGARRLRGQGGDQALGVGAHLERGAGDGGVLVSDKIKLNFDISAIRQA
ncbi:YceI family protein [Streptomyces thioluteus]|uniref:YceI family protein n=1 Tax=Streptomyces thioluteus TaxID=66431 RepID=UPI0031F0CDE9